MVIWPQRISREDENWRKVCALLQLLALDPRIPAIPCRRRATHGRIYFHSADDYLIQPMIYVDKKRVAAPYFSYSVRFAVSCSFHGSIRIDSATELEEFRKVINAALCSPVTTAECRYWEANDEYLRACRRNDSTKPFYDTERVEEGKRAGHWYATVRLSLEESRQDDEIARRSLVNHDEVLKRLITLAGAMEGMGQGEVLA